jgi:hypothetical protein
VVDPPNHLIVHRSCRGVEVGGVGVGANLVGSKEHVCCNDNCMVEVDKHSNSCTVDSVNGNMVDHPT